jgi:hypothetical protein
MTYEIEDDQELVRLHRLLAALSFWDAGRRLRRTGARMDGCLLQYALGAL